MEEKGEYTQYPEAFERLLKELNFPTDNEAVKRVLLFHHDQFPFALLIPARRAPT